MRPNMEYPYPRIEIKCPLCGNMNKYLTKDLQANRPAVYLCDNEAGGCDQYYVAIITLAADVSTHRIEEVGFIIGEAK
jgi:hypothetical protein